MRLLSANNGSLTPLQMIEYIEVDNKMAYIESIERKKIREEIIDKLYDVLQDVEHAEVYGLDCEELGYYEGVLKSL